LAHLGGFHVEFSAAESRADIGLDRPPFNLVSVAQGDQLHDLFEALDDDPPVPVIVIRAEGEHFSSGGNIESRIDLSLEHISRLAWNLTRPSRCSKPVIAANRGYCFGAGFELALAYDFRIVTETTLYALPAHKPGHAATSGGFAYLLKMVGAARIKDIVMRSRKVGGAQAYKRGIATEFVVDSELESITDALVRELLACSLFAQRSAKKSLNDIEETSLPVRLNVKNAAATSFALQKISIRE
jgi:2-oxoglutaroyl-CoA hydrolase